MGGPRTEDIRREMEKDFRTSFSHTNPKPTTREPKLNAQALDAALKIQMLQEENGKLRRMLKAIRALCRAEECSEYCDCGACATVSLIDTSMIFAKGEKQ